MIKLCLNPLFLRIILMKIIMLKKQSLKVVCKISIIIFLTLCIVTLIYGLFNLYLKKVVYPLDYKEQVYKYADNYCLNRALVFAVIKQESSFNKNAISSAGAVGLMQITNSTASYIANNLGETEYNLTDPDTNIRFGCYYIKYLYWKFKNMDTALVAYNAVEGNVLKWLKNQEYSDDGVSLKNIPFKESREYIVKIKEFAKKYNKLYNKILDK